ncbi:M14 family metallopeptidase [Fulvivirga sp. 29W222]|uniref:M14 family metallopeptidase n=1 Tax=Fulvivirga marina TaxID=2494733 RepID=A0A937FWG5_9BACT|nr:M14 family metallopeptidase [Fulvivirga marina]MBL6446293.1 M14 family metallopeptidase [Fulvivirga marina]
MKNTIFLLCLFFSVQLFAQKHIKTGFEQNGGTSPYHEVIDYYKMLSKQYPEVYIQEMDETDSGKPLHMVIVDVDADFDLNRSRAKGKTIIMINNGIHPGEPDGIEASQMLVRDYVVSAKMKKALKDIVLVVIPIYNIGGALNRNSFTRANQNGPEKYGFRGNARNYDLNRDFIKADTKNALAFYEIYHLAKPDIFIDTHVSNGADYQYSITHLATQHNKIGGDMGAYIEGSFTPQLETLIAKKGSEITPYVNVFNQTPDSDGITQFMDYPRYSTGYTTLFNTLGFMIETHMLKPFNVRVKATYNFIASVIEIARKDGGKIRAMHKDNVPEPGSLYPVTWKLDSEKSREIGFKGYEGEMVASKVTGQQRIFYNRGKPFNRKIPYYNIYNPTKEVILPKAYIVPQGWHAVLNRLKVNDLTYSRLENDTTIEVESYKIVKYETSPSAYEGHYPHNSVEVDKLKTDVSFRAGDYVFYVDQPGGKYLVETLEPEATDSFFNWNFFDTILQQKEHFSPYVFEDIAWQLLEEKPELKELFEKKKSEDIKLAGSWHAQLSFIYMHSPYYEEAHMQYPIYRIVD